MAARFGKNQDFTTFEKGVRALYIVLSKLLHMVLHRECYAHEPQVTKLDLAYVINPSKVYVKRCTFNGSST
jgi:hypothetical protein